MKKFFLLVTTLLVFISVNAQENSWKQESVLAVNETVFLKHYRPKNFKLFRLNEAGFRQTLTKIPSKKRVTSGESPLVIAIPNDEGKIERYALTENPVMDAVLAAKFPNIKSYTGKGVDDATSTISCDFSERGFHAMILSVNRKTTYIEPVDTYNNFYIVFSRKDVGDFSSDFKCQTPTKLIDATTAASKNTLRGADDGKLRTFRLALACTGEYAQYFLNGTETSDAQRKEKVLAAMVTLLTRVNGVYERDFGIHLNLVANNDAIIYLNASTDPWTTEWNYKTQQTLDNVIGNDNYDIGHLVKKNTGSGGDGNAGCIGCVCTPWNGITNPNSLSYEGKGSGYTSNASPEGDPFVIDYVAHEMGHQFGANHTFNFDNEGTTAQMEPGSGSTIMGYAGITGSTDIQTHSDDYFHAKSIEQVTDYVKSSAGSCAVVTTTGNAIPTANAGPSYTIPKSTPFALTGIGTDANSEDVLTYTWEQYNSGTANSMPITTATSGPVFRSRPYSTSPTRTFPILSSILDGTNTNTWEKLPSVGRTLAFRFTVRDNNTGAGANNSSNTTITVSAASGPFEVTTPNTAVNYTGGSTETITWSVANTTASPVNCSTVKISLSTDGGLTFPIVLEASTPNDGSQDIVIPSIATTNARIKVEAVGNIFFDISNADFSIVYNPPSFAFSVPDTVKVCGNITSASAKLFTSSIAGFASPIDLSATDFPAGTTVSFNNTTITPGDSIIVTLNNTNTLTSGTYYVTVTGISGSITKTQVITFVIASSDPSAPLLNSPTNLATGQATLTTFNWSAVPAASSYTLEVSLSNTFATHVDSISNITNTTYTLTTPLAENTVYYWRVTTSTLCGISAPSSQFLFKTGTGGCTIFSRTANITFSTSGTTLATSSISIPAGSSVTIGDVNVVGITGTHSNVSDLTFTLSRTSPVAITDTLVNQICSSGQFQNFSFNIDDQSATTTFPCPPTGGVTVTPVNPLSVFNGQTSAGTWTLRVKDNVVGNGGTFTGWGLQICSVASTPLDLTYTFIGNGNWDVPSNWLNSSVPPDTLITGSTIIIDPVAEGECFLNIPYTVAPGSTLTVMPDKKFVVPDNFSIQQN